MVDKQLKEELIQRIEHLTDAQVKTLINIAEGFGAPSDEDYNEENDPVIGIISGPTDLAQRAKSILRDEVDPHSGWTQKE